VTIVLTKTHHKIIADHLDYMERSRKMNDERDMLLNKWKQTEVLLAQKTPVFESEYALEESSPLTLYDCLVPALKQHRRLKVKKDSEFSIEDFKAKKRVLELEWLLEQ